MTTTEVTASLIDVGEFGAMTPAEKKRQKTDHLEGEYRQMIYTVWRALASLEKRGAVVRAGKKPDEDSGNIAHNVFWRLAPKGRGK